MLHVLLQLRIVKLPSDQPFSIEDSIAGIHSDLHLRSISNQPLGISEGYIAWSCPIPLVVGDDFHLSLLPHSHTGVRGAQIYADCR